MRKSRILAAFLAVIVALTMVPVTSYAATKTEKNIKTYIFFGSDNRRNDELWKSVNGGKITTDNSSHNSSIPKSDVIMLFRVNSKKKTVDIVPVYRDTFLDISGNGTYFEKVNNAYSNLGPKKAAKAIGKNLGIKIDGYVASNFKGVANVIDSLGGVTITIENDPVVASYRNSNRTNVPDVMNEYINEMNRIYGTQTPHIKKTGKQRLNGQQAVAYARVRYTDGGEYKRSVRQRTVLSSMRSKYKSANAIKKAEVMLTIMNNIDTNISASTFKKCASYKIGKKKGFPFYKSGCLLRTKNGDSYVVAPCDLKTNVVRLHKYIYNQKSYKADKTVKKYSKIITKKTGCSYAKRIIALDNKY